MSSASPLIAPSSASRLATLGLLAVLAGCTNMAGIGGESTFKCKAPDGVQCQSVSGTYANSRSSGPAQPLDASVRWAGSTNPASSLAISLEPGASLRGGGTPPAMPVQGRLTGPAPSGAIRSDPTVIRIWVAPWEDADGDLMDQTYVYLPVDSGRWLIEHNRQRIKREYAPVRAPETAAVPAPRAAAPRDEESPQDGAAALAAGIEKVRSSARSESQPQRSAQ